MTEKEIIEKYNNSFFTFEWKSEDRYCFTLITNNYDLIIFIGESDYTVSFDRVETLEALIDKSDEGYTLNIKK